MRMLLYLILLQIFLAVAVGCSGKECIQKEQARRILKLAERRESANKSSAAVYIWSEDLKDFLSPFSDIEHRNYSDAVLRGKTFKIIVTPMYPYIMANETTNELAGFIGEIWNMLQQGLQFRNELTIVDYDTGLELMREGKGDVFLGAVVPPRKRILTAEVSQPYFYNWYHVFLRKPSTVRASSGLYLRAFSTELWFASILLFFLLSLILWLNLKISENLSNFNSSVSFINCLIVSCSGFLNQGYEVHVRSLSGRILILFAVVFGFLLYASLNGVLVSQLANSSTQLPFESLEDVAVKRTHSLCVRTESFVYNYFLDSNGVLLAKWKGLLNGPGCLEMTNVSSLAEMLCSNKLAILENRIIMSSISRVHKLKCEVTALPKRLFEMHNYILYSKSFEGRKLISRGLKKIKSRGMMRRLEDKWFNIKSGHSSGNAINNPYGGNGGIPIVGLDHINGILIILILMMVLSTVIMFIEIGFERINSKRNFKA